MLQDESDDELADVAPSTALTADDTIQTKTTKVTAQACAAASIPLYNRFLLKCNALALRAEEWSDFGRAQMKHYILTFVGPDYDIWVLQARFLRIPTTGMDAPW